jgi:NAD(P)-dependent dehydrogenase (short-subunit alcohol dehydrogenase family)
MKKILLVGASGGIGEKVATTLLDSGYEVIGTHNSPFENNLGENFRKIKLNIQDRESIKALSESLKDERLYGIVNCAGIVGFEEGSIEEDFKIWDDTIAINLSSNFYLAKLFEKYIDENGRFIMIRSTDSYYGGSVTAAYSASKAGVNSLTKSLSLVFRDKKIRVNSIAPGWVNTPMIEGNSEEFYKKLAETNPLERIADPEDIAKAIKFLLSADSDYINGQVITIDGGYTNQDPTLILEEETKI